MSSARSSAVQLARLFSSASSPVYAVDDQRQIVYANQACAEWLHVSIDELLGQRCDYHSQAVNEPAAQAASALCPPPEVFAGMSVCADVAAPAESADQAVRTAHFLPIGDTPSACVGAIAVVRDKQETEPANDRNAWPGQLHTQLSEFRRSLGERYALERFAGNTPARRLVRSQVELAAATDAAVLIVGPRGSGRQHVARTIHQLSRTRSSIVPLDCSVAPQGLVEHLIARASSEEAHASEHGILLLVDVDHLAIDAQATLAEHLADASLTYRILATAAEPLYSLAEQGRFREDLACRLSVLTIHLPSLRELTDDLPLLAQWFLEAENARGEKQLTGFADVAMEMLITYHWPGNLDELAEIVHSAHRAADDVLIVPDDLPQRLRLAADAAIQGSANASAIDMESLLSEIELRLVGQALDLADGNKSRAAKQLGMTRQRLYRRLVQLGLEKAQDEEMRP